MRQVTEWSEKDRVNQNMFFERVEEEMGEIKQAILKKRVDAFVKLTVLTGVIFTVLCVLYLLVEDPRVLPPVSLNFWLLFFFFIFSCCFAVMCYKSYPPKWIGVVWRFFEVILYIARRIWGGLSTMAMKLVLGGIIFWRMVLGKR